MEIRNTQNRNIKKYMLLTLMLGGINVFGMNNQQPSQLSRSRTNLKNEENAKKEENAGKNVFNKMYEEEEEPSQLLRFKKDKEDIKDHKSRTNLENEENEKNKQDQFSLYMLQTECLLKFFVKEFERYMNNCDSSKSNDIAKIINDFLQAEKNSNTNFFITNIKKTINNIIIYDIKNNDKDKNRLYLYNNTTCFHNLSELYIEILSMIKKKLKLKKEIDIMSMYDLRALQEMFVSLIEYYFIVEKIIKDHYNNNTIVNECGDISKKIDNLSTKYNKFNEFVRSIENDPKNKYNSITTQLECLEYLKNKYDIEKNNFYENYKNLENKELSAWKMFLVELKINYIEKENEIISKSTTENEIRNEIISKQKKEMEAFQASKIKDRKKNTEQQQMILEQEIQQLKEENLNLQNENKKILEQKKEITALKVLESKHKKEHTEYNQIISELKEELKQVEANKEKELEDLQIKHQKELEKEKEEKIKIKQQHHELNNKSLSTMKQSSLFFAQKIQEILAKNEELKKTYEDDNSYMQKTIKEKEQEIANLERDFKKENEKFRQKIEDLKEQHKKEINNLKEQHEETLRNSTYKQQEIIEKFCNESRARQNIEKRNVALVKELKDLKEKQTKQEQKIKLLEEQYKIYVSTLRDTSNEAEKEKIKLKASEEKNQKLQEALQAEKEKNQKLQEALQALEEKNQKLEKFTRSQITFEGIEKLNKTIHEFAKEKEASEKEIQDLKKMIQTLETQLRIAEINIEKLQEENKNKQAAMEYESRKHEQEKKDLVKERDSYKQERDNTKVALEKEKEKNKNNTREEKIEEPSETTIEGYAYGEEINEYNYTTPKRGKEKNKNNTREERLKKQEEPSEIEGYAYGEEIDEDDIPKGKKGRKKHQYTNTKQEKEEKEEEKREKREKREKEEEKREFKKRS